MVSSPVEEVTKFYLLVALAGFEPATTEPKSVVLPLHHRALDSYGFSILSRINTGLFVL